MQLLRLYLHIPFCLRKCPYCDFNSHQANAVDWKLWTQALTEELRLVAERHALQGRRLASIFFGGGTPSLAPASLIAAVIETASSLFVLDSAIEITLEANPEASDLQRFAAYRQAGVNRLSIGVQSFRNDELAFLGRLHDADGARRAIRAAQEAGFENLNIDLIYALPQQRLQDWEQTLAEAVAHAPKHISCYQLTIEPGTRFAAQGVPAADDATAAEMLLFTRKYLAAAGWPAYEVSNHAQAGWHCRHNDGYWRYEDYIGIGPGAASKLDAPDGGAWRWTNRKSPRAYLAAVQQPNQSTRIAPAAAEEERLAPQQAAREAIWLGLRRTSGVQSNWFVPRFGQTPASICQSRLQAWQRRGWIRLAPDGSLQATEEGLLQLDTIAAELLAG